MDAVGPALDYLQRVAALTASDVRRANDMLTLVQERTDGRLLHGDMGLLHVWFDPERRRITSLIDFGERSSGDPAYDFIDFEPGHLAQVLAGYDADAGFLQRVSSCALAQAIPWAHKWHERGETQVIDRLRYLLRS